MLPRATTVFAEDWVPHTNSSAAPDSTATCISPLPAQVRGGIRRRGRLPGLLRGCGEYLRNFATLASKSLSLAGSAGLSTGAASWAFGLRSGSGSLWDLNAAVEQRKPLDTAVERPGEPPAREIDRLGVQAGRPLEGSERLHAGPLAWVDGDELGELHRDGVTLARHRVGHDDGRRDLAAFGQRRLGVERQGLLDQRPGRAGVDRPQRGRPLGLVGDEGAVGPGAGLEGQTAGEAGLRLRRRPP